MKLLIQNFYSFKILFYNRIYIYPLDFRFIPRFIPRLIPRLISRFIPRLIIRFGKVNGDQIPDPISKVIASWARNQFKMEFLTYIYCSI